jgi:hypothetical protein
VIPKNAAGTLLKFSRLFQGLFGYWLQLRQTSETGNILDLADVRTDKTIAIKLVLKEFPLLLVLVPLLQYLDAQVWVYRIE